MFDIHYFASIRERMGLDTETLEVEAETVQDVIDALVERHGDKGEDVLRRERVLVAVNRDMARPGTRVSAGDEIAFFPPVTGG